MFVADLRLGGFGLLLELVVGGSLCGFGLVFY